MSTQLFESALGIKAPWSVHLVVFDEAAKQLTVVIDFKAGTRFAVNGHPGEHPVHDIRHLTNNDLLAVLDDLPLVYVLQSFRWSCGSSTSLAMAT